MKNSIQTIDSEGNYITPHWVIKSLKDSGRFSSQGKRTKILASQHVGKESVVARCSELFLLDTHFGFLAL